MKSGNKNNSCLMAQLGETVVYQGTLGDTWSSTWLDDGRVFTLSCDTHGWNQA